MTKNKQCSICDKPKHIGFTHFINNTKFRLCLQHYIDWIKESNGLNIYNYILREKKKDKTQQVLK